jgi:nucleolar protein 56
MAQAIQENLSIPCRSDETIREINRGIRFHLTKYIKELSNGNIEQAQLGLGHSYSRTKVSRWVFAFVYADTDGNKSR